MKSIVYACSLAIALCAGQMASAMDVSVYLWRLEPDGTGSVGDDGVEGTELDLQDDLGYGDAEQVSGIDVVLGEHHQLAVSYFNIDISAEDTLNQQVRFSDVVYDLNTDVSSSLDTTLIRGAYRFSGGSDSFSGGFSLGVQYVDLSAEIESDDVGSATEDVQVPIPVVGGFAKWSPLEFLSLQGSISGGSWDFDDISATFIDAEGSARVIAGPVFGALGYRHIAVDGEDKTVPVEVDITFSGPVFYAGVIF